MISEKPIKICGKNYLIRFSTNSLIRIEDILETPITKLQGKLKTLKEASVFIRYGLRHDDADKTPITDEEYEELLESLSPSEFSVIITEVFPMIDPASAKKTSEPTKTGTAGKN